MKAAIYARVSTLEQAEQGYSLIAQQEKLEAYATGMGYSIFKNYVDDGFSGKSLERPAIINLINDVKNKKIDIVLIYKVDRLSRKVKDVLELVELFEKYNVTLFSLNENLDLSSPFGRAALKMSATFSELERETIVERMRMGKNQRAKSGKAMNHNMLPIGYDYDAKLDKFVPNENEKEQVIKIFDLYLNGYSIAQISKYMHEHYTNRYGSYNNRTAVGKIISNPFSCGHFFYNGELYRANNIEPIISYETWLKAEAIRSKNKKSLRRVSSPYLLTGLVRCGICGRPYCAKKYTVNYRVKSKEEKTYIHYNYGCTARVKLEKKFHKEKCTNRLIEMQQLDNEVINFIKSIKLYNSKNLPKLEDGTIASLEHDIEKLNAKYDKNVNLFVEDLISKEYLTESLEKIKKEITAKQTRIKLLKQEATKADPDFDVKKINTQIKDFDNLSHENKRFLLKNIIESVEILPNKIMINLRIE